ncbi:TetR/AcrR family transcriptional regulator [soil metagenome]
MRSEILAAAGRLLDEAGSAEAVTLRAVAREVGVSAPSIYAHFADRGGIVQAVIDDGFAELVEDIKVARDAQTEPVARLKAGVCAVLHFAWAQPARFGVMLGRPGSTDPEPHRGPDDPAAVSFQLLVDEIDGCIRMGLSSCADPHLAATAIMAATHGYALVKAQKPTFPWPPEDELVTYYVTALAHISPTSRVRGEPPGD